MDRFHAMQLFVRIVELGSFSQAAAALEIPRATASHAIQQLEARLETRLLERTTRRVRPTPDGEAYYRRCVEILADVDDAEAALHGGGPLRGTLRVDLHGSHATQIILPRIDAFHARHPALRLAVSCGDRLVDLIAEGIDCVVRAGRLRDSSLQARRLAMLEEIVCASPAYLAAHGVPQTPDALTQHQAVGFFASRHDLDYPFEFLVDGRIQAIEAGGWISVNDAESYVVCARQGAGLVQLPRYHVEEDLRRGTLVRVLADWPCPPLPVSVLYPQHRQMAPRVRAFVDWVVALYAERFGPA